ncbi:hypothetical protein [Polyangium mundeleinium]|uniref:Lipoprotein n=1 Tax=Polyangium mundeleinium TaxID=2995306 RepID=A0ABT5EW77_9BACT|nr:hypothetical protein [Polyangium mundeleinium]MDC0746074.1 hypothetical protein [Polyangium mundeleinium]
MKHIGWLLAALILSSGCNSAIGPNQADGNDCNVVLDEKACGAASYCDPGDRVNGRYPRRHTYGLLRDGSHVVGTCRPKGGPGAACMGPDSCISKHCMHSPTETPEAKGVCD